MQLQIDFEVWIKILEDCYSISNHGNIKSHRKIIENHVFYKKCISKGKELKHYDNGNGYRYISSSINGKRKNYYIHRLVSQAFIPNPENKAEVNHINGIKTDNRVENLEWVTRFQNSQHAVKTGLIKSGSLSSFAKKVINTIDLSIYDSVIDFSKQEGIYYHTAKEALGRIKKKSLNPYKGIYLYLEDYKKRKEVYDLGFKIKRI
jgi:hypothetical protein